ncbi:MAG TPA: hypothetical protein VMK05_12905 [Burkholderiales bacterium]|nr:hypothetical protein [Burkholderiales bacterium]
MNPLTLEALRVDPELGAVMAARARRARAQVVHSPILRLIQRWVEGNARTRDAARRREIARARLQRV